MNRIVVDFDDTLSFCKDRDWENAEPHTELIEKLNRFSDMGWTVDVFTARGSISCKTRVEADWKYRSQIEAFLEKHGLRYNTLSFDKPLATWYIDDKALTPEQFLNEVDVVELTGGQSGAQVFAEGDFVHKTQKDALATVAWYKQAHNIGLPVPRIHSVIGDTIKMEYLKDRITVYDALNEMPNRRHQIVGMLTDILYRMIDQCGYNIALNKKPITYINRIQDHLQHPVVREALNLNTNDWSAEFTKRLNHILCTQTATFAHGDFSSSNILFARDLSSVHLIDPLPLDDVYQTVELDTAKLIGTLMLADPDEPYLDWRLCEMAHLMASMQPIELATLTAAEMIRTIKYCKTDVQREKVAKLVNGLLKDVL